MPVMINGKEPTIELSLPCRSDLYGSWLDDIIALIEFRRIFFLGDKRSRFEEEPASILEKWGCGSVQRVEGQGARTHEAGFNMDQPRHICIKQHC